MIIVNKPCIKFRLLISFLCMEAHHVAANHWFAASPPPGPACSDNGVEETPLQQNQDPAQYERSSDTGGGLRTQSRDTKKKHSSRRSFMLEKSRNVIRRETARLMSWKMILKSSGIMERTDGQSEMRSINYIYKRWEEPLWCHTGFWNAELKQSATPPSWLRQTFPHFWKLERKWVRCGAVKGGGGSFAPVKLRADVATR